MDTELILKHNNPIGHSLPYPYYCGRFQGGSTAVFPLKIAPKHNTKICCPSTPAVTADWADFLMIGANMPRMSKKRKLELSFFLNERGRVAHNILCRKCRHACKQSFRAIVILCPHYHSKRAKGKEDT